MKTTSKILIAVIALFIIASSGAFARGGGDSRFSVGAEVGLPMGNFGDGANTGFGGSLRYEMPLSGNDNIAFTGTAGVLSFAGKDQTISGVTVKGVSQTMIPIQVGAKYYFQGQQNGFYGMVEVGVHMYSYTIPGTPATPPIVFGGITVYPGTAATPDTKKTDTNLSFDPCVGYHLDNFDFGVKYQIISATGGSVDYLGVRVAYVFGSK